MKKEELWYWAWVSYDRGWRNRPPKCPKPTLLRYEDGKPVLKEIASRDGITGHLTLLPSINPIPDAGLPKSMLSSMDNLFIATAYTKRKQMLDYVRNTMRK